MNRIEEMIKEMCHEGVRRVRLKDVVKSITTGLNPRKNFVLNEEGAELFYVTVKEISTNNLVFSKSTDRITQEAWAIIENRSKLEEGDVLFSGIGTIGKVVYVDIPVNNWNCSESVFIIKPNSEINGKYLSYILRSASVIAQYESCAAGAIMKGVRKSTLENLSFPLPPLPIQQEIVKILDSFTALQQNLEDELKLRQKQYEHYREKLLTFEEGECEWKKLGDVCNVQAGGTPSRKNESYWNNGNIKWLGSTVCQNVSRIDNITDYITEEGYNHSSARMMHEGTTLIALVGATIGKVAYLTFDATINQNIAGISPLGKTLGKYVYYYSYNWYKEFMKLGDGKLAMANMTFVRGLDIPVPPLERQLQITQTLDHFESLISNLKTEIELRKKQYEYYREKLLTF